MGRFENAAEEAGWVLAEDFEFQAFRSSFDQVRELIPFFRHQVRDLHQLEVEIDERIVRFDDAVLDLPADVVHHQPLPLRALIEEQLAVRLAQRLLHGRIFAKRFSQLMEMSAQHFQQLLRPFQPAVARGQMLPDAIELLFMQLRRVVAAAAVDQVVRLIDDQHAIAVIVLLLIRLEADVRIEDVVVIADDDVRLLDQLQRHFERTDLVRLRHLERDLRIEVAE